MTVIIDFFQGYELTNLTSLFIEIILAFILGFLIYAMDRRNTKKQEEIISKIGNYTEEQEKGLRLSKTVGLSTISLKLITIITDYKRELLKASIVNLPPEKQLYHKNALLKTERNERIIEEIRDEGLKIAYLTDLGGAAVVLTGQFKMLSMAKTLEDEIYFKTKMDISADSIIEFAENIQNAIESEGKYKIRNSK